MTRACAAALAFLAAVPAHAQDAEPPDLMTFASGVLPVSVSTGPNDLRTGMEQAIGLIDGNPGRVSLTPKPAVPGDTVEITYAMPSLTRFDAFGVPDIFETPSPSQTFVGKVEVFGSDLSPEGPFVPLASGTLATHGEKGLVTDLHMTSDTLAVLWVRVRLSGGVSVETDKTFLEFSEIIGTGTRDPAPVSDGFSGVWKGRGVDIELAQDGATVAGCYDGQHALTGTVDGPVLKALGETDAGIPSQFILIAAADGGLRGLRSSNGAPFKIYDGDPTDAAGACLQPETPALGCGSVLHGIGFDFDSDVIRPESRPLLASLFDGLSAEPAAAIEIVGHSSSEGAADYNRDLSRRRARSVADALVALGLDPGRIGASGMGEDDPIASNDDEAGRSLNRRVEIVCNG